MLRIEWTTHEPQPGEECALVLPIAAGFSLDEIEARFGRPARHSLERGHFKAKPGEKVEAHAIIDNALVPLCFYGVGDGVQSASELRQLAYDAVRFGDRLGLPRISIDLRSPNLRLAASGARLGNLIAQGLVLGTYAYTKFQSEPKPRWVEGVQVVSTDSEGAQGVAQGQIIASAVMHARDLGNGPAELVTPTFLAETAQSMVDELSGQHNVSVTVLDREACAERKMGCYLGVAKGSGEPPKFIHLHYEPKGESHGRLALVGKGVTFDSGGYSLKPSDGMMDMKMDMCGAAAVLASFKGLVELEVPWKVDVIVAATENMIGPHAYRLGDVLTASNGKTVEINNTDAEGRLTLADALVYASGLQPDFMFDFATLTGACMVALGPRIAGVMTPDEGLAKSWLDAAERSGESMWRLPLPDDLKEQLKSKIADMRNTGERWGGALTAGLFLSEFIGDRRWLHVDIAGPSMSSKPHGLSIAGATGFPVATILELLSGSTIG